MTFRSAHIKTDWLSRESDVKHEDTRFAEVTITRMNKGNMKILTANNGILTKSKYPFLNKYKNFFVKSHFEAWIALKEKTKKVKKTVSTKKEEKTSKGGVKNNKNEKEQTKTVTVVEKVSKYGILEYTFTANEEGLYCFKTYYSTDTDCTLNNKRYIDGKQVKTKKWIAYKGVKNVNIVNVHLKKGKHTISLLTDNRCIWLGCVGVKLEVLKADTKNNGYFTLSNFNVDVTNDLNVNTASVTLFNDRLLTEQDNKYHVEKNNSKLLFDWRDEINIKVEDDTGVKKQIFGGYISTLSFDDDFMQLTLNCADRLVDFDHKYCFAELTFMKGDTETQEYKDQYKRNFNRHGAVLNFLTKSSDNPLQNNVNTKTGLIKGETYKDGFHFDYLMGNKYKKKSIAYLCKGKGIKTGEDTSYSSTKTPYMELRNEYKGDQSIDIFNSKWFAKYDEKGIEITHYPTFYIEYGLGDKKKEYQVVDKGSSIDYSSLSGNFKQIAQQLVAGKITITDKARAIYDYLCEKLIYSYYSGIRQRNVDKALQKRHLNCMDSAFVCVHMLRSVGIKAGYVHGRVHFSDGTFDHYWTYFETAHGHRVWIDVGKSDPERWDCRGKWGYGSSYPETLTRAGEA